MTAPYENPGFTQTLQQCWARLGIPLRLIADRELPVYPEATTLRVAERGHDGREHRLIPEAAAAWSTMKGAAIAAGIDIHIVSAHRSIARQIEILESKLAHGQTLDQILAVSAPPGCSEHHTGRAIDVGTTDAPPLETEFESTPAFRWLEAHGEAFGFSLTYPEGNRWGYSYEPWHWCYRETALEA